MEYQMSMKAILFPLAVGFGLNVFSVASFASRTATGFTIGSAQVSPLILSPFTSDTCTDFPNGTPQQPDLWAHCCLIHDMFYWVGGSFEERLHADRFLRTCVTETGHPEVAQSMFLGVRVGGSPFVNTPWRWGYGWSEIRGYRSLTPTERLQVEELQPTL